MVSDTSVAITFWIQQRSVVTRPPVRAIVGVEIEVLSHYCLSTQIRSLKSTMTDGVDLKSLGQFSSKRITIAQSVLKESSEGLIAARPPPPFRDTRGTGPQLLSSEDVANQWIRFGMPPVIVYSAYFANTRYTTEATSEATGTCIQNLAEITGLRERMFRLGIRCKGIKICESLCFEMPV